MGSVRAREWSCATKDAPAGVRAGKVLSSQFLKVQCARPKDHSKYPIRIPEHYEQQDPATGTYPGQGVAVREILAGSCRRGRPVPIVAAAQQTLKKSADATVASRCRAKAPTPRPVGNCARRARVAVSQSRLAAGGPRTVSAFVSDLENRGIIMTWGVRLIGTRDLRQVTPLRT